MQISNFNYGIEKNLIFFNILGILCFAGWIAFTTLCIIIGVAVYCERHRNRNKSEYRFSLIPEKARRDDKENELFSRPMPSE